VVDVLRSRSDLVALNGQVRQKDWSEG